MGFSSISEVGKELITILNRALVPDVILHTGAIGLCSPNDHGDFSVGIYLYDISANTDIQKTGMINTTSREQRFPSTFWTLHYMITAYSSGDLKFRAEEDQRLLGKVVQALADNAVIGETSELYGKPMKTRIEVEFIEPYEKLRLWTFPNEPYRLSLFYRVQPVEITSAKTKPVTRVKDLRFFCGDESIVGGNMAGRREIAGADSASSYRSLVVLCIDKETGRPVTGSNARVYIEGVKPPVIKDDGYRVFLRVSDKESVTIHCQSGIYEPCEREIDLQEWDDSEVVEIELEPGESYPRYEL
ncbi:MAG: DUF4255 domain-containing protein [Lachnospiraceae bacterium]|nr:DUF4255 domain-containing protein [Lachnospiraceae bacterium]